MRRPTYARKRFRPRWLILLQAVALAAVTVAVLALAAWLVAQLLQLAVPRDGWDCPLGSVQYLRMSHGEIGYFCFDPADAKHG